MPQNIPIKFRRDTTANWNTIDPIPNEGEPVYNKETGSFKIGNGTAKWSELLDYKNGKLGEHIVTVSKTGHGDFVCSDAVYTSDDQCIQAALDYIETIGGGELWIMPGRYIITSQLSYSGSNLVISGVGNGAVLDFSAFPTSPQRYIWISGAITTTTSLIAESILMNSSTITVSDGSLFAINDWIRIRSEALVTSSTSSTWHQTVGEIQKIKSISGNVITLYEKIHGNYLTSDIATVDLVTMIENITITNLKIKGISGVTHAGITIAQAYNVKIETVNCDDCWYAGIQLHDVVSVTVTNCTVCGSGMEGVGCGVVIENASRKITVDKNNFTRCRHAVCASGDHHYGTQYAMIWSHNIGSAATSSVGMFGPHPTYDGLTVCANISIGSALGFFGGKNSLVENNQTFCTGVSGIYLQSTSENTKIQNNIIHVIDAHGISVGSEKGGIEISENTIICNSSTYSGIRCVDQIIHTRILNNDIYSLGYGIRIDNDGAVDSEDCTIAGNHIESGNNGIQITSIARPITAVKIFNNVVYATTASVYILQINNVISKISIDGNTLTASSESNIKFETTGTAQMCSVVDIDNNICYGAYDSIDIDDCTDFQISGNKIRNATRFGILIRDHAQNYNIINNTIKNVSTALVNNASTVGCNIYNNIGYNPVGNFTAPSVPASTVAYTNNYGYPCQVQVSGGTVTEITLDGVATGMSTFFGIIPPGGTIAITYSSAPTWKWWGL